MKNYYLLNSFGFPAKMGMFGLVSGMWETHSFYHLCVRYDTNRIHDKAFNEIVSLGISI